MYALVLVNTNLHTKFEMPSFTHSIDYMNLPKNIILMLMVQPR